MSACTCGFRGEPDGPDLTRPDLTATAACGAAFAAVASRFYEDPRLVPARQYVVDAYACQHPKADTRKGVQTTALCLMTLDLVLECGMDVALGSTAHAEMMRTRPQLFTALDPPDLSAARSHQDVAAGITGDDARALARQWAQSVWDAWSPHHAQVRAWNLALVPHRVTTRS